VVGRHCHSVDVLASSGGPAQRPASLPPRLCSHAAPWSGWGRKYPGEQSLINACRSRAADTFVALSVQLSCLQSYKPDDHRDDATVRPLPPVRVCGLPGEPNHRPHGEKSMMISSVYCADRLLHLDKPIPHKGTRSSALQSRMPSTLIGQRPTRHRYACCDSGGSRDVPGQFLRNAGMRSPYRSPPNTSTSIGRHRSATALPGSPWNTADKQ